MPERLGASVDLEGSHVPLSFVFGKGRNALDLLAPPNFLHSLFGQTLPLDADFFLNFLVDSR